jgi:RNA polymerase sigma-70 factor, ECF subfamily
LISTDRLRPAIARAKQGDTAALHYLYVRFAGDVIAVVRPIVRDAHDAEDIMQSVFAKLIIAIQRYEERSTPFSAWLLRVARNAALDHVRARRQIPVEEVHVVDDRDEALGAERSRSLETALGQLPDGQREVVVLRHLAGFTPPEIAVTLGKSESAVHGLHHRGRKALRDALVELDAGPVTLSA